MSTHEVVVVRIKTIEEHPNAHSLDIIPLYEGGFTAIARKGDFKVGDLAIYVEPDYVVPSDAEMFAFLPQKRVKSKKLRGIWSQGLLVTALPGMEEGQNVMEMLGIVRYVPSMAGSDQLLNESAEPAPSHIGGIPKYDLESVRKLTYMFTPGEEVVATEKIHGANARYSWFDGQMYCGNRSQWRRESERDPWWRAQVAYPWIRKFCEAHPGLVLYGEVFGWVQELRYGASPQDLFFRAFDVLSTETGAFWSHTQLEEAFTDEQRCPVVYKGPFDFAHLKELALGDSLIPGAKHLSEGIVIRPAQERVSRGARAVLKLVSDRYLEKSPSR